MVISRLEGRIWYLERSDQQHLVNGLFAFCATDFYIEVQDTALISKCGFAPFYSVESSAFSPFVESTELNCLSHM
jgi:hypothetical protein